MNKLACLVLLLLSINCFSQTKTLNHSLIDSLGGSITSGSIIINYQNAGKTSSDYLLLDSLGHFSFSINKEWKNITLEINSIGYISKTLNILYDQSYSSSIIMKADNILLDEVSIFVKRKVIQKGDTTKFILDDFSNHNETTVEDILKKLPGMTVDVNGNIKYNNKAIDRVLLEGDDLFDQNYKILTKNLSADLLSVAEVIDKYNPNTVLSGISKGEMQVLNLKLKNPNKIFTEGNLTLGGGIPGERFDNKLNLLEFSAKLKLIALGAMNNVGIDPFSSVGENNIRYSNSTAQISAQSAPAISNIREYYYPGIDLQRNNFNNSKLGSFNFNYKPVKQLQLKAGAYIIADKNSQSLYNHVTTIVNDKAIEFTENSNLNKSPLYQSYNLEAIYSPGKLSQLLYQGKVENSKTDFLSSTNLEEINIEQTLRNLRRSTHQRLQLTHRINESLAIDAEAFYYFNSNPQTLTLNEATFTPIVPGLRGISSNGVVQDSEFPTTQYSGVIRLIGKGKVSTFNMNIGLSYLQNNFNTLLSGIGTDMTKTTYNSNRFSKAYMIKNEEKHMGLTYIYNISSRMNISNNTTVAFESLRIDTANSDFEVINKSYANIESRTTISTKIGRKSFLSFQYRYGNRLPKITDLLPSYWVIDYRTLQGGTNTFEKVDDHNFTLNFTHSDYVNSMLLFNGTVSYGTNAMAYINNLEPQRLYDIITRVPLLNLNNGLFFGTSRLEKYVNKLSGNLYADGQFLNVNSYDLSSDILSKSNIKNTSIELGYRSAWDGKLNMSISSSTKFNSLSVHSKLSDNKFFTNSFEASLKLYYNVSEKFNFEVDAQHYILPQRSGYSSLFFGDLSARYILKKDKWVLDFVWKNIFDERRIKFKSISPLRYSNQEYRLLPGYAMLKVYYRF